ncbi:MAG: hypothetical protein WC729_17925 [Sphingomonas sp.]|jgi:hypothetical protein|uniref:hypothetical protein n=1 Tax=Sphingomonas sp. TaxID=28214 RepID=UPI00356468CF
MIARLILSLLLAALTLPSMAAASCHEAPATEMAASHHGMPMPAAPAHDDKAVVGHACIGCIPPSTLKTGAAGVPVPRSAEIRVARAVTFDPGKAPAPDTPPPRAEA